MCLSGRNRFIEVSLIIIKSELVLFISLYSLPLFSLRTGEVHIPRPSCRKRQRLGLHSSLHPYILLFTTLYCPPVLSSIISTYFHSSFLLRLMSSIYTSPSIASPFYFPCIYYSFLPTSLWARLLSFIHYFYPYSLLMIFSPPSLFVCWYIIQLLCYLISLSCSFFSLSLFSPLLYIPCLYFLLLLLCLYTVSSFHLFFLSAILETILPSL